jgi:hypothetical protein
MATLKVNLQTPLPTRASARTVLQSVLGEHVRHVYKAVPLANGAVLQALGLRVRAASIGRMDMFAIVCAM